MVATQASKAITGKEIKAFLKELEKLLRKAGDETLPRGEFQGVVLEIKCVMGKLRTQDWAGRITADLVIRTNYPMEVSPTATAQEAWLMENAELIRAYLGFIPGFAALKKLDNIKPLPS